MELSHMKCPVCLVAKFKVFTLLILLLELKERDNKRTARWSRKAKWETETMESKGVRDKEKKNFRKGGNALFRQSDNLPSPEHVYGCPLSPSTCSLWRQSQWCWLACRFPIICLAEGSCLPIHQQVWTRTLSLPSISSYQHYHTTANPRNKKQCIKYTIDWLYLLYVATWQISCLYEHDCTDLDVSMQLYECSTWK